MSVVAWDGHTLAADKRSTSGSYIKTTTKIRRVGDALVGVVGAAPKLAEFCAWLESGGDPTRYPKRDEQGECWNALVIRPGGIVEAYDIVGFPTIIESPQCAIGSGRDYAAMAMHLGKSAIEAVQLAAVFDENCGNGASWLTLNEAPMESQSGHGIAIVVRLDGKPLVRDADGTVHGDPLNLTDEERALLPPLGECDLDAPMVSGVGLA